MQRSLAVLFSPVISCRFRISLLLCNDQTCLVFCCPRCWWYQSMFLFYTKSSVHWGWFNQCPPSGGWNTCNGHSVLKGNVCFLAWCCAWPSVPCHQCFTRINLWKFQAHARDQGHVSGWWPSTDLRQTWEKNLHLSNLADALMQSNLYE